MIRIVVELWPHGREEDKKVLGTARIWNNLTGTRQSGNYGYVIKSVKGERRGEFNGFPRERLNVWHLIRRILDEEYGARK